MSAETAKKQDERLTWRRYKDGETEPDHLTEVIFSAGWSHKCPTYVHKTPPCQGSCPSGHDVRGWLSIVRGIDKPKGGMSMEEYAFRRMTEANPFPAVMGRVCPAPCEDGCNRNQVEDHVGINAVEHYIGDWAVENGIGFDPVEHDSGRQVAVVGGGPAGLSAACYLRRRGHRVTVFEAEAKLGGYMRYGIPGYRTPRDMLDVEINRILALGGITVRTGVRVGRDVTLDELEDSFDAIFWGIGTQGGRGLPVPGWEGTPNCVSGVDFLRAFNDGRLQFVNQKIVVVGGGDTSIDVASVARRLGHITAVHEKDLPENVVWGHTAHDVASSARREGCVVTLTSLFPIAEMTAAEREVNDARHEGVMLRGSVMPLEILKDPEGRARALRVAECRMEGNRPVVIEGTTFDLEADLIVAAIGQRADLTGLEKLDGGRGLIAADRTYRVQQKGGGQQGDPVRGRGKHFAGGDVIRPHLLTTAIGHGRIAAESIDAFLRQGDVEKRPKVDVHHWSLLETLRQDGKEPEAFAHEPVWGTNAANFAVHNYEDRARQTIITADQLFLGHFPYVGRHKRLEKPVDADKVLGHFEERLLRYDRATAVAEASRCMSCGMCFECDNCVVFCPQTSVARTPKKDYALGRYVYTDYNTCIGCHICADVCPAGYIEMGLGDGE
ncbi:MAG: putative glutamate synthase (NADPH) small subunit [Rhodospirillaceae bacterium]|nr:MAG: putative glutamate synthase (NADPH) small subunit [Rhodospirillaceae bacterium]